MTCTGKQVGAILLMPLVSSKSPTAKPDNSASHTKASPPSATQEKLAHLHQVCAQEEAAGGVLHPLAHLHHVPQDELGGGRLAATDVACPRCSMLQAAPVGGGSKTVGGVHAARCLPPRQHACHQNSGFCLPSTCPVARPPVHRRYRRGTMLPACCTRSYSSPWLRPLTASSRKNICTEVGGQHKGGGSRREGFTKLFQPEGLVLPPAEQGAQTRPAAKLQ
jgi:hypothetical protein